MVIRDEQPHEAGAIRELVLRAFASARHSSGTEWQIVDQLRQGDALTISLVALQAEQIVAHVAVSPVAISGFQGWFGLGPVAVEPRLQRKGIGSTMIREALGRLRKSGAGGCVVLGDPEYYRKFGFDYYPELTYRAVPPPYFQALQFSGERPSGAVDYHPAFQN